MLIADFGRRSCRVNEQMAMRHTHNCTTRIQQRLLAELNPAATRGDTAEVRLVVNSSSTRRWPKASPADEPYRAQRYVRSVAGRHPGASPLEALLADDMVTEILVNGPSTVFIDTGAAGFVAGQIPRQ